MAVLVAVGVQIDAWDTDGGTALHRATLREDATMTDFLLDSGHLVDVENNNQEAPSSWSAPWNAIIFHRNERIIEILLNHGADPNTKGTGGLSELSQTVAHCHKEYLMLLLRREVNPSCGALT
jgi:ankyrin repeat protein